MTKSYVGILVVAVVVVLLVVFLTGDSANAPEEMVNSESQTPSATVMDNENVFPEKTHFVIYSEAGYSPKELTIAKGDIVIFKNESSKNMWPASAIHPLHENYPGSSITKCANVNLAGSLFDACAGVPMRNSWSFTFEQVGSWGYHDHLSSSNIGKIIVE